MDREALVSERASLAQKAKKRRDVPGYGANVAMLDARIAEIDEALKVPDAGPAES